MNRVKITIFFSLIVLIGLIIISIFLSQSGLKNKSEEDIKKPQQEETKINTTNLLNEAKNLPILTGEDADKNFELQEKMPYIAEDFELGYSDLTGQYYVYKKTSEADAQLNKLLEDYKLSNLIIVNKDIAQAIQEDVSKILKYRSGTEKAEVSESLRSTDFDQVKETFSEIIKSLYEIENLVSTDSSSNIEIPILSSEITDLDSIFNEAGTKVGTPPKILLGILTRECPPILSLPNEKIIEYSQPGQGIPIGHGCFKNSIGASGPMQFLPYVWTSYASAVNRFGGYTHTPYIANIRDSIYGAAWKLKRDSKSTDINWTYDQVKRAVICYNAGCGRLSNPPSSTLRYLEAVWSTYTR